MAAGAAPDDSTGLGLNAVEPLVAGRKEQFVLDQGGRGFDVAVNSSTFEGSSLAILEYIATARPIVATAVGGTPDLLGDTGRLVPASDAPALAEAVADLLCDPPTAAALGLRALERQRAEFDIDVQVSRLEALYGETLAAGSRRWRAAPRGSR